MKFHWIHFRAPVNFLYFFPFEIKAPQLQLLCCVYSQRQRKQIYAWNYLLFINIMLCPSSLINYVESNFKPNGILSMFSFHELGNIWSCSGGWNRHVVCSIAPAHFINVGLRQRRQAAGIQLVRRRREKCISHWYTGIRPCSVQEKYHSTWYILIQWRWVWEQQAKVR